jgi:hypothetical protein
MSDPRETRRKSKGALYQQGRASPALGANDPRLRRSAQARTTSELTGAYVRFDEQGRVTIDYDALRDQLQSDLNLSSDAAVTAAQLAGAYLVVSPGGALDVDYAALVADLGLRAMAFEDDAPEDGTPYERQDGAWVPASAGSGLADGDYGDVTASGGGTNIAIDNNAVTFAKMQDIGASTVIGADSAGDPKALNVTFPLVAKAGNLSQYGVGTVEVNLGATPRFQGRFTIADLEITALRVVQCWQAPGPYTGKGTRVDEAEMQMVQVIAVNPGAGSATVYWQTPPMIAARGAIRIGRIRGNVKFYYTVQ